MKTGLGDIAELKSGVFWNVISAFGVIARRQLVLYAMIR